MELKRAEIQAKFRDGTMALPKADSDSDDANEAANKLMDDENKRAGEEEAERNLVSQLNEANETRENIENER